MVPPGKAHDGGGARPVLLDPRHGPRLGLLCLASHPRQGRRSETKLFKRLFRRQTSRSAHWSAGDLQLVTGSLVHWFTGRLMGWRLATQDKLCKTNDETTLLTQLLDLSQVLPGPLRVLRTPPMSPPASIRPPASSRHCTTCRRSGQENWFQQLKVLSKDCIVSHALVRPERCNNHRIRSRSLNCLGATFTWLTPLILMMKANLGSPDT